MLSLFEGGGGAVMMTMLVVGAVTVTGMEKAVAAEVGSALSSRKEVSTDVATDWESEEITTVMETEET